VEHKEAEEHGHGDIEPVIVRKTNLIEDLAEEMKAKGIQCEPLAIGSHPIERRPTSSHMFSQTSRLTTNKGLIKVRGRNIDFVQILQRI
jgi:hypothetical protein